MKEDVRQLKTIQLPNMEERLIEFASLCICIAERLPNSVAGRRYAAELIQASSNTAQCYSKIQQSQTRCALRRNIGLILNEIRVSSINLKIIARKPLLKSHEVSAAMKEAAALNHALESHEKYIQRIRTVSAG